jgi:hypothetical protein
MIISDLTYQELAVESNDLEGGLDFGTSLSAYKLHSLEFGVGSKSGPGGTETMAMAKKVDVKTFGGTLIGFGIPTPILLPVII